MLHADHPEARSFLDQYLETHPQPQPRLGGQPKDTLPAELITGIEVADTPAPDGNHQSAPPAVEPPAKPAPSEEAGKSTDATPSAPPLRSSGNALSDSPLGSRGRPREGECTDEHR